MNMVLVAITVLSCNSLTVENLSRNETVVHVCPNTARLHYEERPRTPMDAARLKHYWSMPRDDRPPPVAQAAPKAETKKVVKTAKKKTKRKKKRRRG